MQKREQVSDVDRTLVACKHPSGVSLTTVLNNGCHLVTRPTAAFGKSAGELASWLRNAHGIWQEKRKR